MPTRPPLTYFFRALFRPKALDVFGNFSLDLEEDGRALGYAQAWHKGAWEFSPYAVYNEYVCGEIGHFLRLPIPPFAITYRDSDSGHEPIFSSLDFNFTRANLPAVIPDLCVEALPPLSAGVVAFDILIANDDRHDKNLVVDNVLRPRAMHIFDHERALLGGGGKDIGIDRLHLLRDRLGITGGPVTGGNSHCLRPFIASYRHLKRWLDRIGELPEWFINAVCAEARHYGLDKALADEAAFFLHHRSRTITQIVNRNREAFPSISDWPAEPADQGELFT
jgi:hypothetical protein